MKASELRIGNYVTIKNPVRIDESGMTHEIISLSIDSVGLKIYESKQRYGQFIEYYFLRLRKTKSI